MCGLQCVLFNVDLTLTLRLIVEEIDKRRFLPFLKNIIEPMTHLTMFLYVTICQSLVLERDETNTKVSHRLVGCLRVEGGALCVKSEREEA